MIYILRHQEGQTHTNCLSKRGVHNSHSIAKRFTSSCFVYTMLPSSNGKHVRPIQTATIMCTEMNKSLNLLENDDIFPTNEDNCSHLIVWHHHGIPKILQKYFQNASFVWDDNNYNGCLLIHQNRWEYVSDYCKPKPKQPFLRICGC